MKITRFEDIEGWQLARELTRQVYAVAMRGAFAKDFGLRDQITRASGSAMHNIAEGFDGGNNAEFTKFLRYSQRSCSLPAFMFGGSEPALRRLGSVLHHPRGV